jgi:uncharacterized protein YecE (DUF72 family)
MDLYVGTSGYSYKEWKGSFYPARLPAKEMLPYYAQQFRTVEINNTFHKAPKTEVLQSWADQTPDHFRFVLKASKWITHIKRLKSAENSVEIQLRVCGDLGLKLGALLLQLPGDLAKDVSLLREFFALLPSDLRTAWEFRHASWFDDEVYELLRARQAALCIAEADSELEVPFVSTANWGYVRLRLADYSDTDLTAWLARIREQNWQTAYVFFKHEEEGKGPAFARRFLELAG